MIYYNSLVLRLVCALLDDIEIDLNCSGGVGKLCNFAAEIQ